MAASPVIQVLEQVWKQLKPPRALSWQTLVVFAIVSWLLSLLAQNWFVKETFARMGSIFITAGVGWALWGSRLSLFGLTIRPAPWITGAIACAFLFQGWFESTEAAFVWWPIVSVVIGIAPRFVPGLIFTLPPPAVRQEMIVLLLLGFTLSSWIKFHFLVQDWLRIYPSLLADDFSRSAFVVRLDERVTTRPRGEILLNQAEAVLRQELQPLSWSEVERWLFEVERRVPALKERVLGRVAGVPEDIWWQFRGQVVPPDYTLKLWAVWLGPVSQGNGYYLEKTCRITQTPGQTDGTLAPAQPPIGPALPPALSASQIECTSVSDKIRF